MFSPLNSLGRRLVGQGQPRIIILRKIEENWKVQPFQCYIPNFKVIRLLVLEENILKDFNRIWVWRPIWSCD